jgi:hypothetical protein
MRINEDGKCVKHGFGQVISTHSEEIKEYEGCKFREYYEVITTETTYIGYWEDDKRCGLGKQYKTIRYQEQKERTRIIEYIGPFKNDLENGEGL